jgi:RNA polymerase sigma-70 factor (ECF subfamily)
MHEKDIQFEDNDGAKSNKDDFLALFLSSQRRIFTFILMCVPNRSDAEDLMQETASWMWKHFDEYTPGTNFGAWGVTVARFKTLKLKSRTYHSRVKFDGDLIDLIDAKADTVLEETDHKIHALRKCLSGMNDRDRRLIYLRYEKGLTPKHLSQLIERPVQGLYKTLARIHKMLLRCIRQTLVLEGKE